MKNIESIVSITCVNSPDDGGWYYSLDEYQGDFRDTSEEIFDTLDECRKKAWVDARSLKFGRIIELDPIDD